MNKEEVKSILKSIEDIINSINNVGRISNKEEIDLLKKIRENFKDFRTYLKKVIKEDLLEEEIEKIKEIKEAIFMTNENMKILLSSEEQDVKEEKDEKLSLDHLSDESKNSLIDGIITKYKIKLEETTDEDEKKELILKIKKLESVQ